MRILIGKNGVFMRERSKFWGEIGVFGKGKKF